MTEWATIFDRNDSLKKHTGKKESFIIYFPTQILKWKKAVISIDNIVSFAKILITDIISIKFVLFFLFIFITARSCFFFLFGCLVGFFYGFLLLLLLLFFNASILFNWLFSVYKNFCFRTNSSPLFHLSIRDFLSALHIIYYSFSLAISYFLPTTTAAATNAAKAFILRKFIFFIFQNSPSFPFFFLSVKICIKKFREARDVNRKSTSIILAYMLLDKRFWINILIYIYIYI